MKKFENQLEGIFFNSKDRNDMGSRNSNRKTQKIAGKFPKNNQTFFSERQIFGHCWLTIINQEINIVTTTFQSLSFSRKTRSKIYQFLANLLNILPDFEKILKILRKVDYLIPKFGKIKGFGDSDWKPGKFEKKPNSKKIRYVLEQTIFVTK